MFPPLQTFALAAEKVVEAIDTRCPERKTGWLHHCLLRRAGIAGGAPAFRLSDRRHGRGVDADCDATGRQFRDPDTG